MLPSEMTRDELAQLLLCYIGVAADIIEFFDSFKVHSYINNNRITLNTYGLLNNETTFNYGTITYIIF